MEQWTFVRFPIPANIINMKILYFLVSMNCYRKSYKAVNDVSLKCFTIKFKATLAVPKMASFTDISSYTER